MTQQTRHPFVVRYLDDLHRLLAGIDPAERAEVVDSVREHLDTSLPPGAGDDDVRAALVELGSPQSVADEAYAGRPRPEAATAPLPPRAPAPARTRLPVVAAAFAALAILVTVMVATTISMSISSSSDGTTTVEYFDSNPTGVAVAFFASSPFWLVQAVLVATSSLWTAREKLVLVAVSPVGAFLYWALPSLGYLLLGVDGVVPAAWTTLVLSVLGGGLVVGVLTRRALRRAPRLA